MARAETDLKATERGFKTCRTQSPSIHAEATLLGPCSIVSTGRRRASVSKAVELSAGAAGAAKADALTALSTMELLRAPAKDALAHAEQAVQAQATPAALAALARAQVRGATATAALATADRALAAGANSRAHEARGEALRRGEMTRRSPSCARRWSWMRR